MDRGEYLNFKDEGKVNKLAKTRKFSVHSRHNGSMLGYVKYFVQWRQYTFFPFNAVFDKKCLREIADFCEKKTTEQREKSWGKS